MTPAPGRDDTTAAADAWTVLARSWARSNAVTEKDREALTRALFTYNTTEIERVVRDVGGRYSWTAEAVTAATPGRDDKDAAGEACGLEPWLGRPCALHAADKRCDDRPHECAADCFRAVCAAARVPYAAQAVPVLSINPYRLPAADPDAPSTEAHDPGECRYCRHPLTDEQERRWGICGSCHDDGTRNGG